MMEKITNLFMRNILWKLMALVLAILLWFLAMSIEDPMASKAYPVNLQIRNTEVLDKYGFVLLNQAELERKIVTVRVWANTSTLNNKLSTTNINAYIELSPVNFTYSDKILQELNATVNVEFPSSVDSVINYTPQPGNVTIVLDKFTTKQIPVTVVKTMDAGDGHVSMEPVTNPATVKVSGAQSIIDTIQSVRVDVSLNGATSDFVQYAEPRIYDVDNKDITDLLEIDTTQIEITVPVNKSSEIAVKPPTISGFVADGYTITGVDMDYETISVVGKDEEISAISEIEVAAIDVNGKSQTFVVQRDVRDFLRNTNVSVRNGKPHEINVTVTIEKEAIKEIEVPVDKLQIIGEHANTEFESPVTITVKGVDHVVNALTADNIEGSIDLTGLTMGEHFVMVNFTLPAGVTRVGESPVIKAIISENEDQEDTEEPQPEPTGSNEFSELPVDAEGLENTPPPSDIEP